ncbi:MAG TPA: orotidine 5'-phosphate decarboxylase / HUMPS family protein, partial [Nitrosopumilaceae archaeon]|nr:orotidine 5'-phosphate decarboxylase / HUMPS family protein [Nitrosopumilaceae archaeon]
MTKLADLILALDSNIDTTTNLLKKIVGLIDTIKVGPVLYFRNPNIFNELKEFNLPIWFDIKFNDIPNTVSKSISNFLMKNQNVNFISVHSSGGPKMMREAVKSANDYSLANIIAVLDLSSQIEALTTL